MLAQCMLKWWTFLFNRLLTRLTLLASFKTRNRYSLHMIHQVNVISNTALGIWVFLSSQWTSLVFLDCWRKPVHLEQTRREHAKSTQKALRLPYLKIKIWTNSHSAIQIVQLWFGRTFSEYLQMHKKLKIY